MSTVSSFERAQAPATMEFQAEGFPPATHPSEPDLFCRQAAMPGHDQVALDAAHVALVGAGGLGSWIALGLARTGVRRLTLIDPDQFDRTNAPRQLMFGPDIGEFKAHALARNLVPHMTNAGVVQAIADRFGTKLASFPQVNALVVGVDNNRARLTTADWGRQRQVPVIFAMISLDGLRIQVFLQQPGGPCLRCVLPNLDSASSTPCAAASIASCYLAAAHAVQLTLAALMRTAAPIWRESSLDGSTERALTPSQDCNHQILSR